MDLFDALDKPSLPEDTPRWLQHASSTQLLFQYLDGAEAPVWPILDDPRRFPARLAQEDIALSAVDSVVGAFATLTDDVREASRFRLSLLLHHLRRLPDATAQHERWQRDWDKLLARLGACATDDIQAFADAAVWGDDASLPVPPRDIQMAMLDSLQACAASDTGAAAHVQDMIARLNELGADACSQALEAVGPLWAARYEKARSSGGAPARRRGLAVGLVAREGDRAEAWDAARLLAKEAEGSDGAPLDDGQLAAQAVYAILHALGAELQSQAEGCALLHLATLEPKAEATALLLVAQELAPFDVDETLARLPPLVGRLGAEKAEVDAVLAQAIANGELLVRAPLWSRTSCAVLDGLRSHFVAVGTTPLNLCCWAAALKEARGEMGAAFDAALPLDAVALSPDAADASLLSLWASACAAARSDAEFAALPRLYDAWREKDDGYSLQVPGRSAAFACALAAAHQAGCVGGFAALCLVLSTGGAALPSEEDVASAVLPGGKAAGRLEGTARALLGLAADTPAWADALPSDDAAAGGARLEESLSSTGLAALTHLVLLRKGARALGEKRPLLLEAILDAAMDLEAGVNWVLGDLGIGRLSLTAEEVAAQLDPVTGGAWLLRVRGFGSGCRSLQASLALAEELPAV